MPALVALAVVALGHLFAVYRDRENKRREQRIEYLIGVYRALAKANHHPRLYKIADELEQAVGDLQLFGTPEEIRLVQKVATDMGTAQEAELDSLLNELRNGLRKELAREPVSGNVRWLRVGRPDE